MRIGIRIAAVAALLAGPVGTVRAQAYARQGYVEPSPREVELTAQGGLFWSTTISGGGGKLVLDASPEAAAVVGLQVDGRSQVEFLYLVAWPRAHFESTSYLWVSSPPFSVLAQYLQVGGLTTFEQGSVEPFLSGGLGLAWFHPSSFDAGAAGTVQPRDAWVFAFHLGGGSRFWISEKLGIRLQARFLFPVLFTSGAFLSGPSGASFQVHAGIPVVQGDLTVGIDLSP